MRPLNLGETLDASIKIVRARWQTLALVMVVISLPIQIANVVIISSTTDVYQAGTGIFSTNHQATTYSDDGAYAAGQAIRIALAFLAYLLGTVACYRAISDAYLGRASGARESLAYATNRLGATLWLTMVLFAGLVVAFIALIIPFIWLTVAWSVAYPVMLVEGTGGIGALKRSFRLTESRWWATLARILVAYILVSVVTSVFSLAVIGVAGSVVDDTSFGALVIEQGVGLLTSLVTTPFLAAVATLVYFDLRVRKEGFDLALLAERMGGPAAAGPPSPAPPAPWTPEREGGRDAFGQPVAPRGEPAPGSFAPPAPPAPPAAPAPAPGSWAPPVAPEPQRPPSRDE
jgi:hypothetical protein